MTVYCFIITLLGAIFSCNEDNVSTYYDNMKLEISTSQLEVTDSMLINVEFVNNSEAELFILTRQEVSISDNPVIAWNLSVLYQDSVVFISPLHFSDNPSKPTKEEYILMKYGGKYTFSFYADFTKLAQESNSFGDLNKDYGEYTLKLTYRDPFCIVKNALNEQIESNVIKVIYKKE